MRLGLTLCAGALIAGCASLPDVHSWLGTPSTKAPTLVGSRGPLTQERTAAVLGRLKSADGADLLARHIAIEEEVAGRPLTVGNSATLLRDGPVSYEEMFEAIEGASDHVNLEFYIIEGEEIGARFSEILLRKAAQGVSINLIYDSVGSNGTPTEYFDRLRAGGVKVLEYNPVNPLKARGAWRVNNRNHRKVVIVDGRVAFTGGINISDVYANSSGAVRGSSSGATRFSAGASGVMSSGSRGSSRSRAIGWRDTNVRIAGPAVEQLQRVFMETWAAQEGEQLPARNWYPGAKREGDHPVRIIASGPGDPVPAIYVALLSAMTYAEKSIHITMAYFVPDPQTIDVLKGAAGRGVDVTLVLPSYTDFWAVFHAGRSHYAELLDSGVKIYERQQALLHAKTIVVDGVWSTVGSSNLDWRSFLHNDELNAVILGRGFGQEMESMFQDDVRGSVRIDRESWARRPLGVRMKEWVGRMWEYWL